MKFELSGLDSYDDDSLLAELRRVAALLGTKTLTRAQFDVHAKASESLVRKRFGGWANALLRAGLEDKASPKAGRVLAHGRQSFTDEEMIAELRSVAEKLGQKAITVEAFNKHGRIHPETIRRRFGSWWAAIERAGLSISNRGRRYSDDDYFENLLAVWTKYGRQPTYGEMLKEPSWIPPTAYEHKWGNWRNGLRAFIAKVNADISEEGGSNLAEPAASPSASAEPQPDRRKVVSISPKRQNISLGLRYDVLKRDHFRCSACGASPSTKIGCLLHIDHIQPVALGGTNAPENLRTLCSDCNIGKGTKSDNGID